MQCNNAALHARLKLHRGPSDLCNAGKTIKNDPWNQINLIMYSISLNVADAVQQNFVKLHRASWACNIFLATEYQLANQNTELLDVIPIKNLFQQHKLYFKMWLYTFCNNISKCVLSTLKYSLKAC